MKKVVIILLLLLLSSNTIFSENNNYVSYQAKSGDGISSILAKFNLQISNENVDFFKSNNNDNISPSSGIFIGRKYNLPIKILKYNGKSIRTTINNNDLNYAKKIQDFNIELFQQKIKQNDYRKDNELWIPLYDFTNSNTNTTVSAAKTKIETLPRNIVEPLFGEKYKNVTVSSNALSDCIFYVVSGHGGPDPGAVGFKDGNELHEDEYAYDVSLRLAKNLMENGAEVYIIVQDANDGIRDEKYLNNSSNETHIHNRAIPNAQLERLSSRVGIINDIYRENKAKNKKQYCIETHVDSRYTGQNVDIFFYYQNGNSEGKNLANSLMNTIKSKYDKAQPGRGYKGSVSSRGLYMLRKVIPTSVFIEIGNIQNPRDQVRIIESNNRQAIANWLCDGFIKVVKSK